MLKNRDSAPFHERQLRVHTYGDGMESAMGLDGVGCAADPGRGAMMEASDDDGMNPGEVGEDVKGRGTTESGGGGPSGSLPAF